MLTLRYILQLFLLSVFVSAEQAVDDEGNPPSLNRDEFNNLRGTYFIKFFSPYCGHCKALEPKWNGAFKDVSTSGADTFNWASVNCIEQGDLCQEESILAYPTLRVYQNGKRIYDYGNPGASQADLRSFALAYASKRDLAFSKEYETASTVEAQNEEAAAEHKDAEERRQQNENEREETARERQNAESEQMNLDKEHLENEDKKLAKAAALKDEAAHDAEREVANDPNYGTENRGSGNSDDYSTVFSGESSGDDNRNSEGQSSDGWGESSDRQGDSNNEWRESSDRQDDFNNEWRESDRRDDSNNEWRESDRRDDSNDDRRESSEGQNDSNDWQETSQEASSSDNGVSVLTAFDFGPNKNVGRWFVLFTSTNCQGCQSMIQKWGNHDRFAGDISAINWGRVDCELEYDLCNVEKVYTFPSLRIYQDGMLLYNYKGETDSMSLRKFLLVAADRNDFDDFNLSDLDNNNEVVLQPNDGQQNQDPDYMSGPVVSKPEYGSKPDIMDVVRYTLETLGQPIDEDPGKVIFGESPEKHHNFRNWGAPDAPPPAYMGPDTKLSQATGMVIELSPTSFEGMVKTASEPWIIKFYSPKCPHCVNMAAEYDLLASSLKSRLNVGAVDCEKYPGLCEQENITHWPFITIYNGGIPDPEYTGPRTADKMYDYAESVYRTQIIPVDSEEQLSSEILDNMDHNITTYVYLYDRTVMDEDWQSLKNVAAKIATWGGKLYRSNSDRLRELAGITHRGSAIVNVDFIGESGEGSLKWYDFPWSNMPKRIRDSDAVAEWAYRAKYSLIQYLDPISQTRFAPYVAVILTEGTAPPSRDSNVLSHKKKALELRDFYRERQIKDQDRIRVDKLNQHDAAAMQNDFVRAREIMKQPIDMPLFTDLAFAYIPINTWINDFSKYIDVSRHTIGSVIIVDFYNGIYIDEFNHMPIRDDRDVLDDLVTFLHKYEQRDSKTVFSSLQHFKKSYKGVPEPLHRSTHFHMKNNGTVFGSTVMLWIKIVLGVLAAYTIFSKVVRPRLRRFAGRQRSRNFSKHD